jgi:hypothetical protein
MITRAPCALATRAVSWPIVPGPDTRATSPALSLDRSMTARTAQASGSPSAIRSLSAISGGTT